MFTECEEEEPDEGPLYRTKPKRRVMKASEDELPVRGY